MPNIKSAKKRVKVIATKAARNKAFNTNLKTVLKKANTAIEGNAADTQDAVRCAIKKIDQACSKGLLHKNTAARRKSQIMTKMNKA